MMNGCILYGAYLDGNTVIMSIELPNLTATTQILEINDSKYRPIFQVNTTIKGGITAALFSNLAYVYNPNGADVITFVYMINN